MDVRVGLPRKLIDITAFVNTTIQSIRFLALSFLYSSTLTSIHDH